jgi:hypothetical protein
MIIYNAKKIKLLDLITLGRDKSNTLISTVIFYNSKG